MAIELDHVIVSAQNQVVSAERLAQLLGVRWAESGAGPFSPVYVNDGLTLDFINDDGPFTIQHFCFRVDDKEFDAILHRIRAAGIKYRSTVRGPEDMQVTTQYGGRMVYWKRARRTSMGDAHRKLCTAGDVMLLARIVTPTASSIAAAARYCFPRASVDGTLTRARSASYVFGGQVSLLRHAQEQAHGP